MTDPIRCFSCGKMIAHVRQPYLVGIQNGKSSLQMFKELKIERLCCKRMLLTHEDWDERVLAKKELEHLPLVSCFAPPPK